MPPPSRPHDPFNDAPRRPTARAGPHHHHNQDPYQTTSGGGHALRSNTTATRNLFAPTLSRRPPTTATHAPHANELVLEDSDDGDRIGRRAATGTATAAGARGGRVRRTRAATETTIEADEDGVLEPVRDLVVRDERGGYLFEVPGVGELGDGGEDEDAENEDDQELNALVREYWASGGGAGGRGSKRWDEQELEKPRGEVMGRLREAVGKKLTDEQWMYEPTDYMEELRVANHGRV